MPVKHMKKPPPMHCDAVTKPLSFTVFACVRTIFAIENHPQSPIAALIPTIFFQILPAQIRQAKATEQKEARLQDASKAYPATQVTVHLLYHTKLQ